MRVFAQGTSGCEPHTLRAFPGLSSDKPFPAAVQNECRDHPAAAEEFTACPILSQCHGRLHFSFDLLARGRKEGLTRGLFPVCLVGGKMLWEVAEGFPHLDREAIHPHPALLGEPGCALML